MKNIEEIINYKFNNIELLNTATYHSSFAHKYSLKNNERLEFLGDSVLGLIVTEYLINEYSLKEGELSKLRAKIVSCENLSKNITENKLDEFIKVSPESLIKSEAIKGDFFEALLGALYLDGGVSICKSFVYKFLIKNKDNIDNLMNETLDYKTKLQELVQAKKGKVNYYTTDEIGLDNDKTFEVKLYINDKFATKAKGKTKQKAENLCAKIACENLSKFIWHINILLV